jgi:hypothetical protein
MAVFVRNDVMIALVTDAIFRVTVVTRVGLPVIYVVAMVTRTRQSCFALQAFLFGFVYFQKCRESAMTLLAKFQY